MLKYAFIISTFLFNSLPTIADEVDCDSSEYSLTQALPIVDLPEFGINTKFSRAPDFCFDPKTKNGAEFNKEFEKLKEQKIFDESNCSNLDTISSDDHVKLVAFMLKVMEKTTVNIYSLAPEDKWSLRPSKVTDKMDLDITKREVIMTNGARDKFFRGSEKLTSSDVLVIGGVAAAATYLGTVASKKLYKGDGFADKRQHEMAGAAINFAGTGLGYLAIETLGVGDRLRMSKHARKCAVTASGTLLLFAAAAGKEAYDKTKPKKHTVDAHDFVATVLGGGGGAPFVISCGFNF